MARDFPNGGADKMARTAVNLSAFTALTISWWMQVPTSWTTGASAFAAPFAHVKTGVNDAYVGTNTNWTGQLGNIVFGFANAAGNVFRQDRLAYPSTGVWHHYLWVASRQTGSSNLVWLDGAAASLTTFSSGDAGGVFGGADHDLSFGGSGLGMRIAEFAIAGGIPTNPLSKARALAGGAAIWDLVDPVVYYPVLGDATEPDYGGGQQNMTVTSTTVVAHPGVQSVGTPRLSLPQPEDFSASVAQQILVPHGVSRMNR